MINGPRSSRRSAYLRAHLRSARSDSRDAPRHQHTGILRGHRCRYRAPEIEVPKRVYEAPAGCKSPPRREHAGRSRRSMRLAACALAEQGLTIHSGGKVASTGSIALATIGFGRDLRGFAPNNIQIPLRSSRGPTIAGANRDRAEIPRTEALPHRTRGLSWEHGVLNRKLPDTNYEALAGLEHELKSYSIVFSMQDIFKLMGPNTAAYIGMGDQLGTLEPGKLADIVLLDGNPLEGIHNMLKTKVVVKGGKIVVDKRQ